MNPIKLLHKNFINTQDWSKEELDHILDVADKLKKGMIVDLQKKSIALLFFNPSLRTRTSFELAMYQMNGKAIVLAPGKDSWPIEVQEGVVMDKDSEEHLKEAVKVLNRYCDAIAVRNFPKFQDWEEDKKDLLINNMAKWSDKPIINMETIFHPCQELALMKTIKEKIGEPKKKKFVLSWTYHPKPLNTAVANSAALISSKFGMDVTIVHPEGYDLDPDIIKEVKKNCKLNNSRLQIVHDQKEAFKDADFVYAKSWGSLKYFGNWEDEKKIRANLKHWIITDEKMKLTDNAKFSHCLPLRRNVKATDEVMDSDYCVAYDEAENRLHVQKALLYCILGGKENETL
jgi:N-acetylornithine carbamoyltransferase